MEQVRSVKYDSVNALIMTGWLPEVVARSDTPISQETTLQAIFPHQRLDGARAGLAGTHGSAEIGTARQLMMSSMAPIGSIGGRGQHAGRRALPPLDIKCSTVRHSLPAAVAKARWWPLLHASLPALTSGGRAIVPSEGNNLQHRRHQRPLPQHVLCMPGCSGRLRLTLCWMVSTFSFVDSYGYDGAVKSLWKPWMSSFT